MVERTVGKTKSIIIRYEPMEEGIIRKLGALHPDGQSRLYTEEIWKVIREQDLSGVLFFTLLEAIKEEYEELEDDADIIRWAKVYCNEIRMEVI